jgi:hypothetical protein
MLEKLRHYKIDFEKYAISKLNIAKMKPRYKKVTIITTIS